jgi:hypothetical protein
MSRKLPPPGFGAVADIAKVGQVEAEGHVGMDQIADLARLQPLLRALPLRMVDDHVGLGGQKLASGPAPR